MLAPTTTCKLLAREHHDHAAAPATPPAMLARELVAGVAAIATRPQPDLPALEQLLQRFVAGARMPGPQLWPQTSGRYTRVLLNAPEDPFQIIVVFWPPGSRSAIHDHADCTGAVVALFGELREQKYAVDHDGTTLRLAAAGHTTMTAGTVSPITPEPGLQLHDMVNASCEWAATMHVYLRAIDHFNIYRAQAEPAQGFVRESRRLWCDHQRGAARWDRPVLVEPEAADAGGELGRVGSCACGALTLELDARPSVELSCYCSDCRRSTGSFMAPLAFYVREAVELRGAARLFERRNDSGYVVRKHFCPDCGTTMLHASESHPHLVGVPVGVLDDATHFRPSTNIYFGSAPPWAAMTPTFPPRT